VRHRAFPTLRSSGRRSRPFGRGVRRRLAFSFLLLAAAFAGPAAAASLEEGVARYTPQAIAQIDAALAEAERMQACAAGGDLECAKRAWIDSHVQWERSETFTGSLYSDLDEAIDPWPDAKSGYHAIEALLFAGQPQQSVPAIDQLVEKLREFSKRIRADGLTAQGLLDGTANLAFETGENKSAGGESAASGTSYDDMRNNIAGVDAVYTLVIGPVLRDKNPKIDDIARTQLDRIKRLLDAAPDLKSLDLAAFRKLSERFAIGLKPPSLGD
jgi:iron uptake system component EfeO